VVTSIETYRTLSRREWIAAMAVAPVRAAADIFPAADAELIDLTAGPLTLAFQPDIAFVRYVRLGDREVLRGIYSAVRNSTWGTVTPRVTDLKVRRQSDAFELTFRVNCVENDIDFVWEGRLSGAADGTVRFAMDGTARSGFQRNRIGFCVLHPMRECAGRPCTVEQVDGKSIDGRFPDLISPHQPFRSIRAISHEVTPAVRATVRLEGDTFEMEDHRNWTDSNFKTYCTPLELPYPVRIARGTRIAQAVTLSLKGKAPAVRTRASMNGKPCCLALSRPLARSIRRWSVPSLSLEMRTRSWRGLPRKSRESSRTSRAGTFFMQPRHPHRRNGSSSRGSICPRVRSSAPAPASGSRN
jgi:hypothetical protein